MKKKLKGQIGIFWIIFLIVIFITTPVVLFSLGLNLVATIYTMTGYLVGVIPWGFAIHYKRSDILTKVSWTIFFVLSPMGASFLYFKAAWVPRETWKLVRGSSSLKKATQVDKNKISESTVKPIFDTSELFDQLIKDIENAEEQINIQYFIISDGIIWSKIQKSLIKKSKEGVKINLVTDFVGNVFTEEQAYINIKNANINFYEFGSQNLFIPSGKMNFRNHNKFAIIDSKIAYTGGSNIGDNYASLYSKYGSWFDMSFRVEGELVSDIENTFYSQLSIITGEKYELIKSKGVGNSIKAFVQEDGPHIEEPVFLNNLILSINEAKETIRIVSPYYIIPRSLNDALAKAVNRNVKVEIITSGIYDKKIPFNVATYFIEDSVSKGIEFYRTNNIFIHTKMYLFDNKEIITGTSNLDYRALFYNYETNLYISDSKLYEQLNNEFEVYKSHSNRIFTSSNDWGLIKIVWNKVLKFISPIL